MSDKNPLEAHSSADNISKEMHKDGGINSHVLELMKDFYQSHKGDQKAINTFNNKLSADTKDILGDVQIAGLSEDKKQLVVNDHGHKMLIDSEDHGEAYRSDALVTQMAEGSNLAERFSRGFHPGKNGQMEMDQDTFEKITGYLNVFNEKGDANRPGEAYSFLEKLNEHLKDYNVTIEGLSPDGKGLVMRDRDGRTHIRTGPQEIDK